MDFIRVGLLYSYKIKRTKIDPIMKKASEVFLLGVLALPLNSMQDWHELKFDGSTKSVVSADASGLTVHVASSSSPIVFALERPVIVSTVQASGSISGLPSLPTGTEE